MAISPVLRWAGSKRKILEELRKASPSNFNRYIEPFAGSAALFFSIEPNKSVIGDINPEVIATYKAIKESPEEVATYLDSIPKTEEAYYILRSINPDDLTSPQRAARLIYLMKSCFNGVYRTNKSGSFNVPFGSRIYNIPNQEHIQQVSESLRNTELVLGDFLASTAHAEMGDFVYFDPPYSDATRFRGEYGYDGSFISQDKERLITACQDLTTRGVKVLLSFKKCDRICDSLHDWHLKRLSVSRSVAGFSHSRRSTEEILASNYK